MHRLHFAVRRLANLVRSRVPWLAAPSNRESALPYVLNRPTVNPVLPVHDMDAVTEFYRTIGFAVTAYDAGYAWVRTCGWEFFHLASAPTLRPGESTAAAYIHVDDVEAWHRAMTRNAPEIAIGAILVQPWGMREFAVTDPAGNVVRFGQHI